MDTKVISTGVRYTSLPDSYVRPESDRPKPSEVQDCDDVPIIDLGSEDRISIVQQIGNTCLLYGFFQVINHGVSMEAAERMQEVADEFFGLPVEEKMKLYSDDPAKTMSLSTSFNVQNETVHNWRDYLRLHCYPFNQYVPEWPSNPSSFNNWPSQALGSHQDDRCKEPKFVLADNLLRMQTPISGNNTSRSQAQEGSHNSIVPYLNRAEDGSTRILPWLGNNQLTPEERHSESETTIQDHYIVDMDSISSGENFHPGTFGVPNSYPPAQVVINLAVPSDTGTQNPTADQYWLKISKMLIPVSAGAVYNSSSMFAKVANTLAFIATLTAISLRPSRSRAIRIWTKFGAIACAAGTLAAVGHDLPDDYRWASGVAFLIPAVAVAVA